MIDGMGPILLSPAERDVVVDESRKVLGARRNQRIETSDLLARAIDLIHIYRRAARRVRDTQSHMPRLATSDGEPLVLCKISYRIAKKRRAELAECLARLHGIEVDDDRDATEQVFDWSRPGGNSANPDSHRTFLGRVVLGGNGLTLEADARERVQRLRALVEGAARGLLGPASVEEIDVNDPKERARMLKEMPPGAFRRQWLKERAQKWLDEPIPALGKKTPREAVRTPKGRREVDLLLREVELRAYGSPDPVDLFALRRQLGLL
jgi:hypothetical protein